MSRHILRLIAFLAFSSCSMAAVSAVIVDQDHLISNGGINRFGDAQLIQSFSQAGDNIAGVRVLFYNFGSDASSIDFTVNLYDALPGLGGNLLASGTTVGVAGWAYSTNYEVDIFWSALAIAPETEYFLELTGSDSNYGVAGINAGDSYTRGDYYQGTTLLGKHPDLGFQTYAEDNFGAAQSAVPEPASLVLSLSGIAGLVAIRRRRGSRTGACEKMQITY